ncbi:RluA family pseudouridine synthase, partial [bacterium]|nr:RluA family pseudouridine synthase [bacterium]
MEDVRRFIIEPSLRGVRLDAAISELMDISRSQVQRWISEELVKVDGRVVKGAQKLKAGQVVIVEIPPLKEAEPQADPKIKLEVLYEDRDIIVINKPRGLVVHPGAGNSESTLVNGLLAHCHDLSGIGGVERPGIVHRLDKDTSGLMVVAKNDKAHLNLSEQFAS